ncbi:unnamed protein product [Cuscuta campestris]|uniref:Late embryogenesis abundant protein LEA-2 subgroup domain-containing protein n=1 Tax=Cuscuta campestris TaxID=132261 RepID=A0A484KWB3_9ASTE|nr:unnamed protein product [Cuscuta campestris]
MDPKQDTVPMNSQVASDGPVPSKTAARRRRTACLAFGAAAVLVALILVVLGFTVFKPKKPTTTVESVSLSDFNFSIDLLPPAVHINLTLDARVAVRNPNRVGFKYDNSSVLLKYRGEDVGDAPIPAGKIGARQTIPMNVTITVMADRLLSNGKLLSDVSGGTVPLSTYTRITGTVRILFKIHVKSVSTCDLSIDVGSRSVAKQNCEYKTKL